MLHMRGDFKIEWMDLKWNRVNQFDNISFIQHFYFHLKKTAAKENFIRLF